MVNINCQDESGATSKMVDVSVAKASRHGETYDSWKSASRAMQGSHKDETVSWKGDKIDN